MFARVLNTLLSKLWNQSSSNNNNNYNKNKSTLVICYLMDDWPVATVNTSLRSNFWPNIWKNVFSRTLKPVMLCSIVIFSDFDILPSLADNVKPHSTVALSSWGNWKQEVKVTMYYSVAAMETVLLWIVYLFKKCSPKWINFPKFWSSVFLTFYWLVFTKNWKL